MIAHRRSDVADLNARARQRLRAAGRIGPDELPADERAFAVGDRVVATRNDRDLAVVNGQAGLVTAIGPRRLGVHFDDGHRVELPDQSVRDVRLDHGYAITAHRAQGITVDRAFVLGSDELYREWGYTALSRHRDEARFYVSATPTFLNAAPAPLQADADVTRQVARMLEDSRAQHLALNGDRPDDLGRAIANELERAHERLAEVDTRLDALHDEHAQTRWYQRSRRSDIERIMASSQRSREHWQVEVARLTDQLEQRPARHEPTLWRGGDPLVAFGRLEREVSHQRDRAHDLDLGLEL